MNSAAFNDSDTSSDWFYRALEDRGEKLCLTIGNERYSYRDLHRQIRHFLDALPEQDIRPGQVTGLVFDQSLQSIAAFLALLKNRNIIVPIGDPSSEENRLRLQSACVEMLLFCGLGGAFRSERLEPPLKEPRLLCRLRDAGQAGLVLFSSGTTGAAKAVLHSLDRMLAGYRDKPEKECNILAFWLFDHISAIDTLFRALSTGATLTIPQRRDPAYIADLIETHRVTVLPASPTFLNLFLLSEAYRGKDLSSLRIIGFGSEPMPASVLARLQTIFPDVQMQQKFGTTETSAIRVINDPSNALYMKIADPDAQFKIVDGELWLKTKAQSLGYLADDAPAWEEDGWFRTGDRVEWRDDGYFRITGRIKELINVGGEKVAPTEVEEVLLQMPGVSDCLVYGQKNPLMNEIVVADVVFEDGAQNAPDTRRAIQQHCALKLEAYKIPFKINLVSQISFSARQKKVRVGHG